MERIKIKLVKDSSSRKEAYNYFRETIYNEYGNYPSPLDDSMELLVAYRDRKIVGTVGIYFGNGTGLLPFEKVFDFGISDFFQKHSRINIAFVSRWASSENNIGMLLSYYGGVYIQKRRYEIVTCILKPRVAMYLNYLSSNSWNQVVNIPLNKNNIHESDLNYFLTTPQPKLYYSQVEEYTKYLSSNENLIELKEKVDINF